MSTNQRDANSQPSKEDDEQFVCGGPRKTARLQLVGGTEAWSKVDYANYYAGTLGFKVFPVRPNHKDPFSAKETPGHPLNGGVNIASKDPDQIAKWFEIEPEMNYGIALDGHTAVDIDIGKGEHWRDEFKRLKMFEFNSTATLTQGSARGGFHLIYKGEVKNCTYRSGDDVTPCIDVISGSHRYVVGAGSTFDGGTYVMLRDQAIVPLPDGFRETFGQSPTRKTDRHVPACELGTEQAWKRGKEYMSEQPGVPESEGKYGGRDKSAFVHACQLKDIGCDKWQILSLLADWDDTNLPPLGTEVLEVKVDSAFSTGQSRPGCRAPEADFGDLKENSVPTEEQKAIRKAVQSIVAEPFILRRFNDMEPREFLFGGHKHVARKFLNGDVAPGGLGKTSLVLSELIFMATGFDKFTNKPIPRRRVWYHGAEDPAEETERRIMAVCKYWRIKDEDIYGWLHTSCGRKTKITIAEETKNGVQVNRPVVEALTEEIKRKQIDVFWLDPFIRSHGCTENDNNKIARVCDEWLSVAERGACAIGLSHHARKSIQGEPSADDSRGASAFVDAMRAVRNLVRMTESEAAKAGITNPRSYFKITHGKHNMYQPSETAQWFKFETIGLGNARPLEDLDEDVLGVVVPWSWPKPFDGITAEAIQRALQSVRTQTPTLADKWRADIQATEWVGIPIAEALGLSLSCEPDKARVKAIVKNWIGTGYLIELRDTDHRSKPGKFVELGPGS